MEKQVNTVILGAGAAGLMCAAHSGPDTLLIDHATAPGQKIRISGGGRCNFTNLDCRAEHYLSQNPHFVKSALARYSQWDFIDLVARHGIAYHEKALGQLFCDDSAQQIIDLLLDQAQAAELWLNTQVVDVEQSAKGFTLHVNKSGQCINIKSKNIVLATGGKSIPKMGATGLAYQIAQKFGLPIVETRPGLVPLTFDPDFRAQTAPLSGTALPAQVTANSTSFAEGLLFTHRGLSGPSILQISNYWREGDPITLNLSPTENPFEILKTQRQAQGRIGLPRALSQIMPKPVADLLLSQHPMQGNLADQSDAALAALCDHIQNWTLKPTGTEGYRTAEVTLGGVNTNALNAKTMQAKSAPGLYVIGEAVDVTGWLGGYNFQWAWSSGWAAGTHIASLL
jgi:predicted Rossmann fold flavoprotein